MGATNKYYLKVQEQEVNDLPNYLKERLAFIDDNTYADNELFKATYSKYVKAKKELEIVKYNIRHNIKP